MKPTWRIEADGNDITAKIRDRLLSLTVKDEAGSKSDTVDLELDDRDHACPIPPVAATLAVYIGWESPEYLGTYVIDEISMKGNAKTMTVRGKASEEAPKYKEPVTTSWDQKTIQEIVGTIATKHGLEPLVHPKYQATVIDHIDQSEESDGHFLTRLGKLHGAVAKVADGKLIFTEANSSTTPSGKSIAPVTVKATQTKDWRATLSDRGKYNSVTTKWHDHEAGREQWVTAGTGADDGQAYKDRRLYRTKEEALAAGQAKLKDLTSGKIAVDLTLAVGNPYIYAEGSITLEGFRDPIEGETLIIKSVTHKVANEGFTTQITAGNKGEEGSEQGASK